jgi:hypothetical protein
VSSNRWYKAVMQDDGNFVVYNKALKAVWSTLTYTKGLSTFKYQDDGNLVVYDAFNRPTWNSNTQNQAAITALTFTKLIPDRYPRGDQDALQLVAAPNFPAGTSSLLSTAAPRTREIWPGESLTSANGWYQLLMQRDGNLVVYNKANEPVWNTGTGQPCKAVFQQDGNLVLYRYSDGAAIWNAGSYLEPTSFTPTANFPTGTGIILAGNSSSSKITIGQNLYSPNGWYRLTMQNDGNLVLYSKGTIFTGPPSQNYNIAVWSSGTVGSNATYAHFQDDGNLVLYTAADVPVWKSNNGSYPQYAGKKLFLQNDGNLVIYGTGSGTSTTTVPADNLPTGSGQILCANAESSKLYKGQSLYSTNGWYRLTMQADGNLVIYSKADKSIWSTGTGGTAAHYAYFQADGNLVLYDNTGVGGTGNPVWWLNKGQYPQYQGYRWVLADNGGFFLYDRNNTALWLSYTGLNVEPTVTKTSQTSDVPLWHTATGRSAEPGAAVYPEATLALSNNGTLTITAGGATRFTNGYNNANEPQIETETGDNRQHAFLWEIFGSADSQSGQTKTVSRTFTSGNRTITFSFVGTANFTLPANHYSDQTKSWTLTSATYTASTGKWYLDEWLELLITTSESNPFRDHPNGTLSPVGRQYRINGVLSSAGSLILQNDGNLVQYDTNNVAIWSAGYYTNEEPKVSGTAPAGFKDVCGKRLSSCEARFGTNVDLPFGSFPGVGQFFA